MYDIVKEGGDRLKLSKKFGGGGSVSYAISIGMKEAISAGFVDENGDSYDLEKLVNDAEGVISIRRTLIEDRGKGIYRIIQEHKDALLSGDPVMGANNAIYWIDKDTLYEKSVDGVSDKKAIARIEHGVFILI